MALRIDLSPLIRRLLFSSLFNSLSSCDSIGGSGIPPPPPDIEEKLRGPPEVPPEAVSQLSPIAHAPAGPRSSTATGEDEIKSSSTSLTERLAPATFCTAILASIPPMVQENYHSYWLYEPLLAVILLGVLSSAAAVFCARRKSHRREAEAGGNDMESKLLNVGLVCSVVAFVLRILLQLTVASFLRVSLFVFVFGVCAGYL